jgi:hypothetical protein
MFFVVRKDLRLESFSLNTVSIMTYVLQQLAYVLGTQCPNLSSGNIIKCY